MMRILSAALLCCAALSLSAAEKFSFVRPVRPGEYFECAALTRQSARYSFALPGRDDPVVKLDTFEAEFQGYLTVREVNAAGNPVRLRLSRCRFSGSVNGRTAVFSAPGTEIEADLSDGKSVFTADGASLSPDQQILLGALFPPASSDSLADLTGPARVLPKPGQGWKPELKSFLEQLKSRGITLTPAAFRTGITCQGIERIGKTDCRKFSLLIETVRLTDFDCRFRCTFWLAPSGPPVRMMRDATEVIRRVLRSDEPFAAGTRLELIREDHTEQSLTPVPELPPLKAGKKQPGAWDFLLR